ncbi:MAG TPA: nicotinate phosphoribosyltransferase, partial [Candidatus Hydrogenedentes bacterium]|nr:nicotinate phosphoribosyltransferase [Candidatus Hydrogenedentota bacterium]
GRRTAPPEGYKGARDRAQTEMAALPDEHKRLRNPEIYRVLLSERLGALKEHMMTHPELA